MSRRHEPDTPFMMNEILDLCHGTHEDFLEAFLCDWHVLGQLHVHRLGEWVLNEEIRKAYPKLVIDGTP